MPSISGQGGRESRLPKLPLYLLKHPAYLPGELRDIQVRMGLFSGPIVKPTLPLRYRLCTPTLVLMQKLGSRLLGNSSRMQLYVARIRLNVHHWASTVQFSRDTAPVRGIPASACQDRL